MKRIGLFIERHWHYGRRLCEGIAEFARTRGGWSLEFPEWSALDNPRQLKDFDGFVARVWNDAMARTLCASARPVVNVYGEGECRGAAAALPTAGQGAVRIGQMAARHFIEHRFSHFAFCGYAGQGFSMARRDAFVRALELNRLDCAVFDCRACPAGRFGRKLITRGSFDFGIDRKGLARWLKSLEKPVAVFCAHDLLAWNLLRACQACGIAVPNDVALLGVDNDPLLCDFTNPTLSSVDPNPFGIGYAAAELLDDWFAQPQHKPTNRTVAPLGLVERASTQVFPVSPPWLSDALVFIRRNINRNINATEVFRHLGLSHTIVERAFRNVLGSSVQREIAAARIAVAKHYLEKSQRPIAEVCALSGFSSKAYFTTAFSKATGKTPGEWRSSRSEK